MIACPVLVYSGMLIGILAVLACFLFPPLGLLVLIVLFGARCLKPQELALDSSYKAVVRDRNSKDLRLDLVTKVAHARSATELISRL